VEADLSADWQPRPGAQQVSPSFRGRGSFACPRDRASARLCNRAGWALLGTARCLRFECFSRRRGQTAQPSRSLLVGRPGSL